eukprot:3773174-Pyramimonas_sp.AAC.1
MLDQSDAGSAGIFSRWTNQIRARHGHGAPANNRGENRILQWLKGILMASRAVLVSGAFSASANIKGLG